MENENSDYTEASDSDSEEKKVYKFHYVGLLKKNKFGKKIGDTLIVDVLKPPKYDDYCFMADENVEYMIGDQLMVGEELVTPPSKLHSYAFLEVRFLTLMICADTTINVLDICWPFPEHLDYEYFEIKATCVRIMCENSVETMKWIERLGTMTKALQIEGLNSKRDVLTGIGLMDVVINAKSLIIDYKNDINDDQLLSLNGLNINISKSNISDYGINRLIKQLLINPRIVNGKYFQIQLEFERKPNSVKVFAGLTKDKKVLSKTSLNAYAFPTRSADNFVGVFLDGRHVRIRVFPYVEGKKYRFT